MLEVIHVTIVRKSDGLRMWASGGYASHAEAEKAAEIQLISVGPDDRGLFEILTEEI